MAKPVQDPNTGLMIDPDTGLPVDAGAGRPPAWASIFPGLNYPQSPLAPPNQGAPGSTTESPLPPGSDNPQAPSGPAQTNPGPASPLNPFGGFPFTLDQIVGAKIPAGWGMAQYQPFAPPSWNVQPGALSNLRAQSAPRFTPATSWGRGGFGPIGGTGAAALNAVRGNSPGASTGGGNAAPPWLQQQAGTGLFGGTGAEVLNSLRGNPFGGPPQMTGSPWDRIPSVSPFAVSPQSIFGAGWGAGTGAFGGMGGAGVPMMEKPMDITQLDPLRRQLKPDQHKPLLTPDEMAANRRANYGAMTAMFNSLGLNRPGILG